MVRLMRFYFFFILFFIPSISAWANLPYTPIQFPRDDAAHYANTPYPVKNITEWWYYNGKFTTTNGRHFGYYITYMYAQNPKLGHKIMFGLFLVQIADIDNQKVYGYADYYLRKKSMSFATDKLDAKLGTNTLTKNGDTYLINIAVKPKKGPAIKLNLQLTPTRDALLASKTGLIDMSHNTNSYYYSYTNLKTAGNVTLGNEALEINPKQSISWMDHQWGDFTLTSKSHWVWASVQLENGLEMDLAASVDPITKKYTAAWANIIMPDGSRVYLTKPTDFQYSDEGRLKGQQHPNVYNLVIPSLDLKLHFQADVPGQDVDGVWEGISTATGTYQGKKISGIANTESTVKF